MRPTVREFFENYLDDLVTLSLNLEAYFHVQLLPRTATDAEARTLIIFDEVQFCPRACEAIKYLVADRRFDYIETGSLISIKKNAKRNPRRHHPKRRFSFCFRPSVRTPYRPFPP